MAAPKPPQILQLSPASEIVFEGPFKNVVTSDLELTNPSDKRVCFKVKTTAPRRYCVRPNSGIIEPGAKIKIHVMLQPLDAEGLAEGHKHKFMVQSLVLSDDNTNLDSVWSQTDPRKFMDSKLRCIFHTAPPPETISNAFNVPAPSSTTTTTSAPSSSSSSSQQQSQPPPVPAQASDTPSKPVDVSLPPSTTTTITNEPPSPAPNTSSKPLHNPPPSSTTKITTTATQTAQPGPATFSQQLAMFFYGIFAMWFLSHFISYFWSNQT